MPVITEEVWQRLQDTRTEGHKDTSIMTEAWPHIQEQMIDKKLEKQAQSIFGLISQIRNLRSSLEIKPEQRVEVSVYPHSAIKRRLIKDNSGLIINLARLLKLNLLDSNQRPQAAISSVIEDIDIYLHFSGLLDITKEQSRIKEKIAELLKAKGNKEARINNPEFLKKAPADIVEKEKISIFFC